MAAAAEARAGMMRLINDQNADPKFDPVGGVSQVRPDAFNFRDPARRSQFIAYQKQIDSLGLSNSQHSSLNIPGLWSPPRSGGGGPASRPAKPPKRPRNFPGPGVDPD